MERTLEEAIKYYSELAEANEKDAEQFKRLRVTQDVISYCYECAEEHRQLAEWIKELKKWKALRDSINMLCDVDCEYPQYRESGTMCDACPIGTVKEYFEQIFDGEVNADE